MNSNKHRLSSGNYLVTDDATGRRIGYVARRPIPTAKVGYVQFVAYIGTHTRTQVYAGVHETLSGAIAAIERSAR